MSVATDKQTEQDRATAPPDESRASAFFAAARAAFESAAAAAGTVEQSYRFAGHIVRLRFAGPALLPAIEPALAHLAAPATAMPDLTVCLWDDASTGVPLPPCPWAPEELTERSDYVPLGAGRVRAALRVVPGLLCMLDAAGVAIWRVPAADAVPGYERAAPLRTILDWWLGDRSRPLGHAGAVGTDAGGALLVGRGGSGKSTTSLLCLEAGMAFAGDDFVALGLDPAPVAYGLYASAKLNDDVGPLLPGFAGEFRAPRGPGEEKALVFLRERHANRLRPELPIRAILLPRVTGRGATALVPISPVAALAALAPSTLFLSATARPAVFRFLGAFVRRVPSYRLELGDDPARVPSVVARALERG
jgi:hypothetical protein